MTKHTKLIEQLEAAESITDVCTAFRAVRDLDLDLTRFGFVFPIWVRKALNEPQTGMKLGYFLLAAMKMVPEGWALRLDRYLMSDKPHPKTWRVWLRRLEGFIEDENAPIGINMKFGSGHHPCTALAAACLRAMDEEVFDISLGNGPKFTVPAEPSGAKWSVHMPITCSAVRSTT